MKTYKKIMDGIVTAERGVAILLFITMVVLTFSNVVSRKFLNFSLSFTEEITTAAFVIVSLLGSCLLAREGGHIALNFFTDLLPKPFKKPLIIFTALVAVILCAILVKTGTTNCIRQISSDLRTPALRIPQWTCSIWIPICCFLMALHFIEHAVFTLFDGTPQDQAGESAVASVDAAVPGPSALPEIGGEKKEGDI